MLQRVANYKDLTQCVLMHTTSLCENGVCAIVVKTSRFDGITASTTFQDRQYLYLAKCIDKRQRKTLRPYMVANFTYYNVTASGQLQDTRGKPNTCLNGTTMAVHMVSPYSNEMYNQ